MEAAMSLPTVKDAVDAYLADVRARGLVDDTVRKTHDDLRKAAPDLSRGRRDSFPAGSQDERTDQWRRGWKDGSLARQKKHERVIGFFWFCVRQGWRFGFFSWIDRKGCWSKHQT
jgi:integrase/recombinase XerD